MGIIASWMQYTTFFSSSSSSSFFISTYLPIRFSLSLKGIIFTSKSCETYPFKIAAIYIIRAHSTFVYIFIYCPGIEVNPYSFSAFLIDLPFFGVVFSAIWLKLSFCNDEYRVNVASSINAPGYWNTLSFPYSIPGRSLSTLLRHRNNENGFQLNAKESRKK